MSKPLRALVVEDSEEDARLLVRELRRGGYDLTSERVDTAEAMTGALARRKWDIVLADYALPTFDALAALAILQKSGLDIPFIIVSGTIGEDTAVEAMTAGAHDYLLKGNLARLVPAVERELREAVLRRARRSAEESLRESERRLRLLVESVKDYAIFMLDPKGSVASWNPGAERIFGYRTPEIIGRHFSRFHPGEEVEAGGPERDLKLAEAEGRVEDEGWRVRKDGARFWANVILTALRDRDGKLSGFAGVIRDITERKEAEEALRKSSETVHALVQASPVAITLLNPDSVVEMWNRAAERIFGWSQKEVLGRPFPAIPAEKEQEHRAMRERVLRGGAFTGVELVCQRKDGSPVDISFSTAPLRDGQGRASAIVGVMEDISERKQAEAERSRLLAETERLARLLLDVQEEERRQVAYDIHDGPAQQIVAADMFLEIYRSEKRQKDDSEVEAHLEQAKEYLSNAIRDTRRIISDLRPLVLDDFGLVEALRHYLGEVEGRVGCRVDFQTDMSGVRFEASAETVLFRIAQEAVTNALKHAGAERLAVRLVQGPDAFVLEVRDWGAGFDPEKALAIRGEGRGVGLVSMRERAELMGAKFHLESSPGLGTTIRVEVPKENAIKPGGTQEEGVIHVPTNTHSAEIGEKNGIRVLIADDHPMVRQGLRSMLNIKGIEVIGEASDGQEAVERVRELSPDVVLMDVRMPDMDGLTATEVVKEEAPSTSVIIVTSYESKDYLRRAIEAGAAGYLLKGMSRDSLIEAIKLVRGGGSLIDAKLLAELLQDMGVHGSRFEGAPEGALEALSPREQEVLQFLVGGLTNKEIAKQMNYSVGTVKNVVQRVIEKLGVSDRTQAAVFAVRAGLSAPSM